VRLPHPLPIYQQQPSFLATGTDQGQTLTPSDDTKLTSYTVIDDVVVPPEYERYVIVKWGDRVFFPTRKTISAITTTPASFPSMGEPLMTATFVKSTSYPLSSHLKSQRICLRFPESFPIVVGYTPTAKMRTLLGEFYNMGGSISDQM